MSRPRRRRPPKLGFVQREKPVACPFCEEAVDRPTRIEGGIVDTQGGRCECGALYVADLTGRQGGQCLMDGLTLLCEGDMGSASELIQGQDYELIDLAYRPRTHSVEPKRPGPRSFGQSKLWFVRRMAD